ncbi:hypothetical protein [Pseudorhodoferax aquiterrae]|uniref:hypothetical protein n=1 Tax=Pseudorhodoferax aquiterrae TaxID=747304 RepID=UPI00167ACB20|nr:hypothetical protein [Pseudorhodoferax aquiterrae]
MTPLASSSFGTARTADSVGETFATLCDTGCSIGFSIWLLVGRKSAGWLKMTHSTDPREAASKALSRQFSQGCKSLDAVFVSEKPCERRARASMKPIASNLDPS